MPAFRIRIWTAYDKENLCLDPDSAKYLDPDSAKYGTWIRNTGYATPRNFARLYGIYVL
jgi:hypothetical protein